MALSIADIANLDTSKKILIFGVLHLLLVGIYGYFLFLPKYRTYLTLEEDLGNYQLKRSEQELIAKNLPKFREQVKQLDGDLNQALAQLPNKKEIPNLLTSISNLGREVGLDFLLFRPLPEVPKGFYAEVPVEIKVIGSYHQVAMFFDKVSKLPRIVNISDITMGDSKEDDDRLILKTFCLAVTFKFLEGWDVEDEKAKKRKRRKKS